MGAYKDPQRGTWYAAFYYTDWTGARRHKVKRGFKTMREAKAWENDFINSKSHLPDITFKNLAEAYLNDMDNRLKPTTLVTKRTIIEKWLLPKLEKLPIGDIDVITIRGWQNYVISYTDEDGECLSGTYIKTLQAQLSAILNYAVKNYGLPSNPCLAAGPIGQRDAEEMQFWTQEQYEVFRNHEQKRAYQLAFDILFYTGVRSAELLALYPSDFTEGDVAVLHVRRNYSVVKGKELITTPKTKASIRDISIPQFLYDEMRQYCDDIRCKPDERIFYFGKHALRGEMKRVTGKAGLPEIRVHDMRHSHAALLINMGINMKELQRRLGHKSIRTTMDTYGHLYPKAEAQIGSKLEQFDPAIAHLQRSNT